MAKDSACKAKYTRFVVKAQRRNRKSHSRDMSALSASGMSGAASASAASASSSRSPNRLSLDMGSRSHFTGIDRLTIEINGGEQVALNTSDECEGLYSHGEIAVVEDVRKSWRLELGWNKRSNEYWISINGTKFNDMDVVPWKKQSTSQSS